MLKKGKEEIIYLLNRCIEKFEKDKKYLILVPRIILMEQLKEEIVKHKPEFKNNIQCIASRPSSKMKAEEYIKNLRQ